MQVGTGDLKVERQGHVAVVTMHRPESRNAFSAEMLAAMADAWDEIDEDDDVRVAVLTGAGGHFCAGADLRAMSAAPASQERFSSQVDSEGARPFRGMLRGPGLTKPLIAAVEGYAVAGGTEILLATDIRVAARSATFGVMEVTRGLFPLGGSTVRLRRQVPHTVAMELLLTGRLVSAEEAHQIGLVGRVVDDGQALATALEIAEQIAGNGPLAVQAVKRSVQRTEAAPEAEALAVELEEGLPILGTRDAREGPRAFAEKRPPRFEGA